MGLEKRQEEPGQIIINMEELLNYRGKVLKWRYVGENEWKYGKLSPNARPRQLVGTKREGLPIVDETGIVTVNLFFGENERGDSMEIMTTTDEEVKGKVFKQPRTYWE